MNPWFGKIAVFVSLLVYVLIRWPHGNRMGTVPVVEDRKGGLEIALLIGAGLGTTLMPLVWITTPLFAFADYPLHPVPFVLGLIVTLPGLWLFYRSHADLGINWSVTLQMREQHRLISNGVYSRIRHPMYASMFLLGIAQVLLLPNWFVGPAYLLSFGLLYCCRAGSEERMMVDHFGSEYEEYMQRTGRLVPRMRSRG